MSEALTSLLKTMKDSIVDLMDKVAGNKKDITTLISQTAELASQNAQLAALYKSMNADVRLLNEARLNKRLF